MPSEAGLPVSDGILSVWFFFAFCLFYVFFGNASAAVVKGVHDISGDGGNVRIADGGCGHESVVGFAVDFDCTVDAFDHAVQQDVRFVHNIVRPEKRRKRSAAPFPFLAVAGDAVGFVHFLPFCHDAVVGGRSGGAEAAQDEGGRQSGCVHWRFLNV